MQEIVFTSADDAWNEFKDQYFQGSEAAEGFRDDNPLVNSANYAVYMNQIEKDAALLEVLETQKPKRREKQLIQSVQKYVSVNMFPLYQQGEFIGACSLFTDITELNHLTSEVQRISQVQKNTIRRSVPEIF